MWVRYPRTSHLPWSPGATADDVRLADLGGLAGREVVVTEKLDGENTTLYRDGLHARSLDSAHHPSRAWVKALHGAVAAGIPPGWRVCGENLYARHSIEYRDLESWFSAFSVWAGDRCLGWDETVRFARRLGVPVPRVLWRGVFDERALRALWLDLQRQEGYVVRTVDGFDRAEFAQRVAKWVRRDHVRTDEHWMLGPVVPNGRGAAGALWDVRAGLPVNAREVLAAVGFTDGADEVLARLDLLDRTGDARLAGVLAALLHGVPRPRVLARLSGTVGMPLARRVADLVGLHTVLHRAFPDVERRAGLVRLSAAADLGVLHAVAAAAATDAEARDQVSWSALHAEEAGLLGEEPLGHLRSGLREALRGHDVDVADRCWAQAREAFAAGRLATPEEAVALTWRWRAGNFPRLVAMSGPAGAGKSTFVRTLRGVEVVSLDDLREARGSRADQRANGDVLRAGLRRLDAALARGGTVVWDATSLNRHQRQVVRDVADRRDVLVTHAVMVVDEEEVLRRNAEREHRVPPEVVAAQLARFVPPYPGEAHRTWYVGPDGGVADVAGSLDEEA
ncbi:RNA ligase family protein [Streptoalloteichus hindustanus]|uniref:Predicted kinase n=1 Tax=Streptoalloteichus hindustanus TaxID=2017 RepID=A0A1M5I3W4_STRHI|nr:RNA ligase family protein [Streptoalloteichus hindustanus]SHG22922.1 Predicted kinase [Streptoalloteichus hindustanus]